MIPDWTSYITGKEKIIRRDFMAPSQGCGRGEDEIAWMDSLLPFHLALHAIPLL